MKKYLTFFIQKITHDKKTGTILKILLNFIILTATIYILIKKRAEILSLFNTFFLFALFCEFIILFLISLRILFLSSALGEKISLKNVYFITLTTKFYNIFFPTFLAEGIRGIKYHMAGIASTYNVVSIVLIDRIIGFITFFIMFLFSLFLLRPSGMDMTFLLFSVIMSLVFVVILFNIDRIKGIFNHKNPDKYFSKKALFSAIGMSFIAHMAIMLKYFFIFRLIAYISLGFIKTVYICSASHLSQIIPVSYGLFSIKDGFLFYVIKTEQGEYTKALSLILVLGSIEMIMGIAGGILESIGFFKKTLRLWK